MVVLSAYPSEPYSQGAGCGVIHHGHPLPIPQVVTDSMTDAVLSAHVQ